MTLTSDLKNILFIGFLDLKNVRKVVSFIILAFFIFFQYLRTAAILNFGCKKKASSYFFRVFRFFGSWGLTLSYNKNSACYIFLGLTLMLLCYPSAILYGQICSVTELDSRRSLISSGLHFLAITHMSSQTRIIETIAL